MTATWSVPPTIRAKAPQGSTNTRSTERKPEMRAVFDQISPLKNAHKIKTGLLVVHGKNDPRVPFSEAEQIAPQVRANGQTVWTVYADDEGRAW